MNHTSCSAVAPLPLSDAADVKSNNATVGQYDSWAVDVLRTLGGRYNESIRQRHYMRMDSTGDTTKLSSSSANQTSSSSSRKPPSSSSTTDPSLGDTQAPLDGTRIAHHQRLLKSFTSPSPIAHRCNTMEWPSVLSPPPDESKRDGKPTRCEGDSLSVLTTALSEEEEHAASEWFPVCFYSQMLTALDAHHSVSNPNTPRRSRASPLGSPGHREDQSRDDAALLNDDEKLKRTASRLETYSRRLKSATFKEQSLSLMLFDGVERRAAECNAEIHEMIAYVRQLNSVTEDAARQLKKSRSIEIPRVQ